MIADNESEESLSECYTERQSLNVHVRPSAEMARPVAGIEYRDLESHTQTGLNEVGSP